MALFTNPQGVWNAYSSTWDVPPGHTWNGKYWEASKRSERNLQQQVGKKTERKGRRQRERDSSDEESDGVPVKKKLKAAVRQAKGQDGDPTAAGALRGGDTVMCFGCKQPGHIRIHCPNPPKCFACGEPEHFARDCTNSEAKSRNDEYMKRRTGAEKPSEN